jgi:hypothetical protein
VSLGLVGCSGMGVGKSYSRPEAPAGPQGANAAPRTDCSSILGTAFRSSDERKWFEDNCQKWPLTQFDTKAAGPLAAGCAEIKGRPYTSDLQRTWYLQNCLNTSTTQTVAAAGTTTGDRHDCNTMRGTPYQSETERTWYLANCNNNNNTVTQQSTSGPRTAQQAQAQQTQLPPLGTVPGAPQQAYQMQAGTLCGLPIGAVDQSLQALHRQVCGN